jgi:hypothetical protein
VEDCVGWNPAWWQRSTVEDTEKNTWFYGFTASTIGAGSPQIEQLTTGRGRWTMARRNARQGAPCGGVKETNACSLRGGGGETSACSLRGGGGGELGNLKF